MTDIEEAQLVTYLGRDLVATFARRELPMYRAQTAAYFKDPGGVHGWTTLAIDVDDEVDQWLP